MFFLVLFSIVITVYNKEKYLERCLNSILQDKSNDYEVVIIDDGSTDSSYNILKKYASKYKNIKLYRQRNKGIGYTRRKAISLVNGKYLLFVDADDTIESDLFNVLRNNMIKHDYPDIIKYDIFEIDFIKNSSRFMMNSSKIMSGTEALYEWNSDVSIRYGLFSMYTFKTELWKKHLDIFSPLLCYEDICNITKILYYAEKIVVLDYVGYTYYRVKDGITFTNKDKFMYFKEACSLIMDFYFEKLGESNELYKIIEKYYRYHLERKEKERL